MADTLKMIANMKNFILSNYIAAIATSDKLRPYTSHIYYVSKNGAELYFISRNDSIHVWNLKINNAISGSMFERYKDFEPDGEVIAVQFIGEAERISDKKEATEWLDFYGAKLLGTKTWYPNSEEVLKENSDWSIFKITIQKAKIRNTRDRLKPGEYMVF